MKKKTALLIIDMLNTLDFPEGKQLLKHALPVAKNILKLKQRFQTKKLPVIYVNDNFENWNADWKEIYEMCSDDKSRGKVLAEILKPDKSDYFILKPKHSGFHASPLEILLKELKVDEIIATGIAGNMCVLFTAYDGHMLGFKVVVPEDCIACNTVRENTNVITQLKKGLKLSTTKSSRL